MNILKEDFFAVPDGEIYPKMYRAGDAVTGQVADAARRNGLLRSVSGLSGEAVDVRTVADKFDDDAPKRRGRPPKHKSLTGAPENK